MKIKKPVAILLIIDMTIFAALLVKFLYNNVIVPEPYEIELKTCLEQARQYQDQSKVDAEENKCFRTYPHFN